jgi:hypothetical protein
MGPMAAGLGCVHTARVMNGLKHRANRTSILFNHLIGTGRVLGSLEVAD